MEKKKVILKSIRFMDNLVDLLILVGVLLFAKTISCILCYLCLLYVPRFLPGCLFVFFWLLNNGKEDLFIQYMILLRSLWKFLYFKEVFNIIFILLFMDSIGPLDILLPSIAINEFIISFFQFFSKLTTSLNSLIFISTSWVYSSSNLSEAFSNE